MRRRSVRLAAILLLALAAPCAAENAAPSPLDLARQYVDAGAVVLDAAPGRVIVQLSPDEVLICNGRDAVVRNSAAQTQDVYLDGKGFCDAIVAVYRERTAPQRR